jgi:hypothetical protein
MHSMRFLAFLIFLEKSQSPPKTSAESSTTTCNDRDSKQNTMWFFALLYYSELPEDRRSQAINARE